MLEFSRFDKRSYDTVPVKEGYKEWMPSYEDTVDDRMDLEILERVASVPWDKVRAAADLGCGTGRTGVWLRSHGVGEIDGVDVTPAMLEGAREKAVYRDLAEADVRNSGLASKSYDIVICCLVDEHLPDLAPLYAEAERLMKPGGCFVLVGFHPFFIMRTGMPTHFDDPSGKPVAIETHVHLLSDQVAAAAAAGLTLTEMHEAIVDRGWLQSKPGWEKFLDWPFSFVAVWRASPPLGNDA